ncbi:hypothetical protein KR009_008442 [Drosophila setifemur]|nr:hypothetical protein KR009_008442 [Drosophila setifemur]
MKVFIFVLSLLFVLVQIKAQGCPEACITLYNPVCGEAIINGRKVRCQFSNSCFMGVSGCRNNISKYLII